MDILEKRVRRHARLQLAVIPPLSVLDVFDPDEDGRVEEISWKEARERGLAYYLSRRLSPVDKVIETKDRVAVCVRSTQNRLSLGELELASRKANARERNVDAATVRAILG